MHCSRTTLIAALLALATASACGEARDAETSAGAAAVRTSSLSAQFNSHDSSVWEMASWANGTPFNCGFAADHVAFADGFMTLELDNTPSSGKSYSGGEYRTIERFSYGRFETRMKAAKGSGIVSSFFTYTGSPWDEIDVEILGKNTSQAQLNYYVNGTGGHEKMIDLGFDASAGFHTYAIDWQPNSISWYVDGVLKHTVTGSTSTLPSHPMQIMMNLWNGIGVDGWLGSFHYSAPMYASYDYVTYAPPGASTSALGVSGPGAATLGAGGIPGCSAEATMIDKRTASFMRSLAMGQIEEEILLPFPDPRLSERETLGAVLRKVNALLGPRSADFAVWDAAGAMPPEVLDELKRAGLFGLVLPERHGGMGLSATGYARVLQEIAHHDASVAVTLGAGPAIRT